MTRLLTMLLAGAAGWCAAAETVNWPLDELMKPVTPVEVAEYTSADHPGVKGVFFDGVPCGGRPTRIFAYIGIPDSAVGKLPAVILVHGGGGSAFRWWTERWMRRGYAVLALDTTGGVPKEFGDADLPSASVPHPEGGPGGRRIFVDAMKPFDQQWPYHAVCGIIRANTLLRQLPQVDPNKIGVIGLSWGAVMSQLAVSLDHRFCFGVFVYGNGFLADSSSWAEADLAKIPPAAAERWSRAWDPAGYLGQATLPVLFCNGATDRHFRPDSWLRTAQLVKPELRTLCCRPAMGHSHIAGDVPEIAAFADAVTKGGPALPVVRADGADAVKFSSPVGVRKAQLVWTADSCSWPKRKWRTAAAAAGDGRATAKIPEDATAWYFAVTDVTGRLVSSELQQRGK